MRRKALGEDSQPVARTLANMGAVCLAGGNLEAAARTYPEAVERLSRALGTDHPDVAHVRAAMGELFIKQKRYAESEPVLLRALEVRIKAYGEPHPRNPENDQGPGRSLRAVGQAGAIAGLQGEPRASGDEGGPGEVGKDRRAHLPRSGGDARREGPQRS